MIVRPEAAHVRSASSASFRRCEVRPRWLDSTQLIGGLEFGSGHDEISKKRKNAREVPVAYRVAISKIPRTEKNSARGPPSGGAPRKRSRLSIPYNARPADQSSACSLKSFGNCHQLPRFFRTFLAIDIISASSSAAISLWSNVGCF